MTSGHLIQKLFLAFAKGDVSAIRCAAQDYIAEEKRKNHHVFARELERILMTTEYSNGAAHPNLSTLIPLTSGSNLPHDKERGTILVEMKDARRDIDELVLSAPTRSKLLRIIEEQRRSDVLQAHGIRPASKVLFCGPPGCGKTVAAEAIARTIYRPLVIVRFDAVISSYLGDTASNLRKVFEFARTQPMVLLFDEFDAIGKRRDDEEEHGELKRVVNSFLQMLDSFISETLVIAATNHQGLLDSALWRRFDEVVQFEKPNKSDIESLLRSNLRQVPLERSVRLSSYAQRLIGNSHADIERVAQDAIKQSLLQDLPFIERNALDCAVKTQLERSALSGDCSLQVNHPRPTTRS